MGRIFGAAFPVNEVRREDPDHVLQELSRAASPGGGQAVASARSDDDAAAAGYIRGPAGYLGGISRADGAGLMISFCGYLPGLSGVLSEAGLEGDGDAGACIISLYRKYGTGFLEKLPGLFSLALYDEEKKRFIVAGDRYGLFPVYYSKARRTILFSSSIHSMARFREDAGVNRSALTEYLFFDAEYGSSTFYSGISIIPYGGYITIDTSTGKISRGSYFRYEDLFDAELYAQSRGIDAPARLTAIMKESVSRIMDSRDENSFGLLCGGGVDCSFIGAVMKEAGFRIPVFCATVIKGDVSEEEMARTTVEQLGSDLHVGYMTQRKYYPLLIKSILDFGQPIAHPNLARFYISAETTRMAGRPDQILGVASDLLFGGQSNVRSLYKYLRTAGWFSFLPARAKRVISMVMGRRDTADLELRLRNPLHALVSIGMGNFERGAARAGIMNSLESIVDPAERAVKALMLENLCDYQQHLLNRRYEMSMRNGMALWFPFLDIDMVRFAVSLPVSHCVGWRTSKKVVRSAARKYLGTGLASRAKWGGDVPIDRWIKPLKPFLDGGFMAEELGLDTGLLGPLLERQPKLLWNMIDIELWGRLCLGGADPEDLLERIRENGLECDPFESV